MLHGTSGPLASVQHRGGRGLGARGGAYLEAESRSERAVPEGRAEGALTRERGDRAGPRWRRGPTSGRAVPGRARLGGRLLGGRSLRGLGPPLPARSAKRSGGGSAAATGAARGRGVLVRGAAEMLGVASGMTKQVISRGW